MFLNIAGYKFIALTGLALLRQRLYEQGVNLGLKGTILLGEEGINLMLAGTEQAVITFTQQLTNESAFSNIELKKSYSAQIPFKRLLVKVKKEIITFGVPGIKPQQQSGKYLPPKQFKRWLDEQKELVILDVRNRCEVAAGTFSGALDLGINNFRSFADAAQQLEEIIKTKTVVMFCTGGIRCEKASAYLLQQGFQDVYQLQGGILQYFTDCGDAHFVGKCFVFDGRGVVDSKLCN